VAAEDIGGNESDQEAEAEKGCRQGEPARAEFGAELAA
jgi:hypothetical protein